VCKQETGVGNASTLSCTGPRFESSSTTSTRSPSRPDLSRSPRFPRPTWPTCTFTSRARDESRSPPPRQLVQELLPRQLVVAAPSSRAASTRLQGDEVHCPGTPMPSHPPVDVLPKVRSDLASQRAQRRLPRRRAKRKCHCFNPSPRLPRRDELV
jgi:hypothetical protein